ncbi:hypothetical protein [Panacagrimonas sp.]|uniref:hypothetical protein n=1 Tax=Panacagrimonas sp. TaxID=2480088 RepID=UPI003B525767
MTRALIFLATLLSGCAADWQTEHSISCDELKRRGYVETTEGRKPLSDYAVVWCVP